MQTRPRPFAHAATLACSAFALLLVPQAVGQDSVEYAFEFVADWSAETHPESFPGNPHFSPVVGALHSQSVSLWEPGGIATPGIEQMAETGASSILNAEVQTLVASNEALGFLNLGPIALSPGVRTRTFTATGDFTALSLVTMIAPSPDWFVGIHGLELRPDGIWAREIVIDLDPYDSGTDAGPNYTSPNANIANHLPIANIAGDFPFTGTPRIGTFRVTLISDAACSRADIALPYEVLDLADITAFVDAFIAGTPTADIDRNGLYDLSDINGFVTAFINQCP